MNWRNATAIALGAGLTAAGVPVALAAAPAAPPRADVVSVVMCLGPGAAHPDSFERVDVHAVDPGNKDQQVTDYARHHPGWTCWLEPVP